MHHIQSKEESILITYNFMSGIRGLFGADTSLRRASDGTYEGVTAYGSGNFFKYDTDAGKDYTFTSNSMRLLFGTGDTAESPEDYQLAELTTDYTVLASAKTLKGEYGNDVLIYNRTIQAGESGLTVKEQGLVVGYSGGNYLLARDVLPAPVVLHPYEKHTFTMSIGLK